VPGTHIGAAPEVRPLRDRDRAAVARFLARHWGSPVQVVHGTVFRPA
jgi:hypothetical protein